MQGSLQIQHMSGGVPLKTLKLTYYDRDRSASLVFYDLYFVDLFQFRFLRKRAFGIEISLKEINWGITSLRMQEKQDWAEGEVELECCNSLRQFYRGLWSWNSLGKVSQIEPDQTDMNPQALASHSAQATSRERVQTWVRQLHSADGISPKGTQLWVVSSHHCLSTMAALDSPQNYCMAPPCYSKPIVSLRMQLS